jgi:hypothetical protein
MRTCKKCGQNKILPSKTLSNDFWIWENKKDRSSGGLHYCRFCRTTSKRLNWNNFYNRKRLRCVVSRSINQKLKAKGGTKTSSILKALPYSIEELKIHLESKFESGMNWENYGDWHIDHIKPDNSFNYDNMEDNQFKECWSLNNLQPLWATDNWSKSKKMVN